MSPEYIDTLIVATNINFNMIMRQDFLILISNTLIPITYTVIKKSVFKQNTIFHSYKHRYVPTTFYFVFEFHVRYFIILCMSFFCLSFCDIKLGDVAMNHNIMI